ncbi:hypothetical protein AB0H76_09885 [Nocardia sp. NPDC050712]|uniref:hypothetical protein n=1 Tax=Nocardia sp. NPDC050712 TaxID=3155518 RepID=UPI003408BD8D
MPTTTVRHVGLRDMLTLLESQQATKVDVVAPATAVHARDGLIELSGVEPAVDERGVTPIDGLYLPTAAADSQIATKLDIPVRYLRKLREQDRSDLYDANVNGWLHGRPRPDTPAEPDSRQFLLRLFTSNTPGEPGVLRALLSDRYGIVDNLDLLTAVMDGIRQADEQAQFRSCDLSDTALRCKVYSPGVAALAPHFLRDYRNPFANPDLEAERQRVAGRIGSLRSLAAGEGQGYAPGSEPVVFAGFRFSNSETGHHALTLKPELVVKICGNGLTLPMFAFTKRHLGDKLDVGAVGWSQDTLRKRLAVITAETRDKVREWLSPQFLGERVAELEDAAATPVTQPDKTIEVIAKNLGFSESERSGILAHFVAGGQLTGAGIANAVTSFSQTLPDPDRADVLDDLALSAMALA